jgi:hypothetical protein
VEKNYQSLKQWIEDTRKQQRGKRAVRASGPPLFFFLDKVRQCGKVVSRSRSSHMKGSAMDWILSNLSYGDLPAFFLAVGASYYLCAIAFQGATPLVGTWVTYTALTSLTAYGMYEQNALTSVVMVAIFFDILILLFAIIQAFIRSDWGWGTFDRWCFGAAAVGGCLSLVVSSPNLAIATGVLATTAAAIPTAHKALHEPNSESGVAYAWFIISSGFAVMQMPSWAFEHSFQPIMWLLNGAITFGVIGLSDKRRNKLKAIAPRKKIA